jgi:putative ABC transport system substrate-binding protein
MRRRDFITAAGAAAALNALPAAAQQAKRLPVVAIVFSASPVTEMVGPDPIHPLVRTIVHGLRDLGWIDGRSVVIERRSVEGDPQRAPAIFAELIARGVDVIVLPAARWLHEAAQRATGNIPIVAAFSEDPVAAGLIASLARPGGNLTGVTRMIGPEYYGKQLQLLQELAPGISRAALLGPQGASGQFLGLARSAAVAVVPANVDVPEQYEEGFATILREQANALIVTSGGVNFAHAKRIVAFASENRLPAIFAFREPVDAGGLMAYAPSTSGTYRQLAGLVDKFLKGAKIGEIPTEQPIAFELVINAKTAKVLGLIIPPSLFARADEVIE